MTISAARNIYQTARYTERRDFRIEDMLFTGIIRQKAGIEDIHPFSDPGKNNLISAYEIAHAKPRNYLKRIYSVCAHHSNMKKDSKELLDYTLKYMKYPKAYHMDALA